MIYEIETEEDYLEGLRRFLEIAGNPRNSAEEQELYLLMELLEKYERNNCSSN